MFNLCQHFKKKKQENFDTRAIDLTEFNKLN